MKAFVVVTCFLYLQLCVLAEPALKRSLSPASTFAANPFSALIVAGGTSNTILLICGGSILNIDGNASHILTSAYCIQNRTDPNDPTKQLAYRVLIPDSAGSIELSGSTFSEYKPFQRILHPGKGTLANFTFTTVSPNGNETELFIVLDTNDVGIVRLDSVINVSGAQAVRRANSIPTPGQRVDLLGFGAPNFYRLHKTDSLEVIPSSKVEGGAQVPNSQVLFFRDTSNPNNASQAIEVGDEGGPIIQTGPDGKITQVAIAQGTWRVSTDNGPIQTYASLGPIVATYNDWIQQILDEPFVLPNPTNETESGSGKLSRMYPFLAVCILLISCL